MAISSPDFICGSFRGGDLDGSSVKKADDKDWDKLICQLEEPVAPAIADALICALQIANRPLAVVAAFLTAGYRTMGRSQLIKRRFIPLGRIYHGTVIQIEKMLQAEIHPDSFTCSRKDVAALLPGDDDEIDFSQRIALHGERFNFTLNGTGLAVFVFPPHDGDFVISMESISCLLEGEAFIPFTLTKMRRRLFAMAFLLHVVEERFVGTVNTLHHVLDGLTPKSLPFRVERFLDLRDMLFQLVGRKVLSVYAIVSSMHRNAVVPDGGGNVDTVIQMFVLFAFVIIY